MNFEHFNLALLEIEEKLRDPCRWENAPPFYFVIGAPRSGTTLLTQLLAYCFDFGYVTNLAARFWLNPVVGIQFSKEVLGKDVTPSFNSHYANTRSMSDIHEFGRFWMAHLGLSSSQDVDWMVPDEQSASLTLQALGAIRSELNKPVVMKGIYPAYCYRWMNEQLGNQVRWVNIMRDPKDVFESIIKARKAKGDFKRWFGWHIPKSDRGIVGKLSPKEQIVTQIAFFRKAYSEIADVTVFLEQLCDEPERVLKRIVPDREIVRMPPDLTYRSHRDSSNAPA